ncbi:S8 family serine peptidase [Actinoplanes sp. HUAS TT8]|uniref:S8 family serine peptidase n=1 Tax=Actinoplanes sp. HUAS TT8 TaxID=3447453 RepID=UPI003F51C039
MRMNRDGAVVLTGVLVAGAALAGPVPVRAAGAEPPPLPAATEGCVGPSPVVADQMSWAFRRVGPASVWPLTRGAGVTVAVVDTGVSRGGGGLGGPAVLAGQDVTRVGRGDADCLGRGTALAAVIAARPTPGSLFVGVAPEATVLPIRVVGRDGKVPPQALAKGIRAATAAGADVVLVGLGTPTPDASLRAAVREALARDVVVVAAVTDQKGSGGRPPAPWYPASDDSVIAVGGITANGLATEAGSPGSGLDLFAPGEQAYSVGPDGTGNYTVGGSAVAAAYVAGSAALVRAYLPKLTADQVTRRLITAAEPGAGPGVPGSLDVYAAVAGGPDDDAPVAPLPAGRFVIPAAPGIDPVKLIAGVIGVVTLLTAGIVHLVVVALRRGRRRRWRP